MMAGVGHYRADRSGRPAVPFGLDGASQRGIETCAHRFGLTIGSLQVSDVVIEPRSSRTSSTGSIFRRGPVHLS